MAAVRTTCPYCGVGCGVIANRRPDGTVEIAGDPAHPANFGRLCSKGSALGETLGLDGRLLHPEIRGRRASWDAALDLVAGTFAATIREHGPDSVALYVSGQLLTEDYYVANKLTKGFLGTANIDTNSRLCMASAVAGHKRAFGTDTVPCSYTDLEAADLVLLVGSNLAWCHPILFQRLAGAKERRPGMRVVVVDPRRTATCELADLHLAIRPGMDALLFAWLLSEAERRDLGDEAFVSGRTSGADAALAAARAAAPDLATVAAGTGLERGDLKRLAGWLAERPRTLTLFSQGVNQSSSGTDKVNAIINLHLLTGRIGKPGAGPFSITGQPNAMGGREVGGLANQLAAHVELGDVERAERVRRFWGAPRLPKRPGLKAVELFRAVADGKIRALWIMGTNPAVSLPEADAVRAALGTCPFVVVSDGERRTDTTELAHVLLPAAAWGEKDGTVTNSERRISRQRAFLPLPGEARPDWWILTRVAQRLGFAAAFPYGSPEAIFAEHAQLSGLVAQDFDIAAAADRDYATLEPFQWGGAQPFAEGRFFTADGRARFVPITPRGPAGTLSPDLPLRLNTGRYRDQWHSMTRTGRSAKLARHRPEPCLDLHPEDARRHGLVEGGLARVESPQGTAVLRVRVSGEPLPGTAFAPLHWNAQSAGNARIGALIAPVVDPVSGQPELKAATVQVRPCRPRWSGFALLRAEPVLDGLIYWVRSPIEGGWRYELAGDTGAAEWHALARRLIGAAEGGEWLEFRDEGHELFRAALVRDGRILGCLFIGDVDARDALAARFGGDPLEPHERAVLLAGRSAGPDPGPIVCACFGIGRHQISQAIARENLRSAEAIGRSLRAGTNCGSCLPELRTLIATGHTLAAGGHEGASLAR